MIKRLVKIWFSLAVHVFDVLVGTLRRIFGLGVRDRCVVLYYHGVTDAQRERFARQMGWLGAHTKIVPVARAHAAAGQGRCCCVTFDDALDSVRVNAVPVCEGLDIPVSIYAVSGNLGVRPNWTMPPGHPDASETIMTADQLRSLPPGLVTVGSHTATHRDLAAISPAEQAEELGESKGQLEAMLERPVTQLSVPYGSYRQETIREATRVGYETILTCAPEVIRPAHEAVTFGRFKVTPDDWMIEFRLAALGAYRWRKWWPGRRRAALESVAGARVAQADAPQTVP